MFGSEPVVHRKDGSVRGECESAADPVVGVQVDEHEATAVRIEHQGESLWTRPVQPSRGYRPGTYPQFGHRPQGWSTGTVAGRTQCRQIRLSGVRLLFPERGQPVS